MIKRIIAILLAWSCGFVALHAANSVTVRGAEGDVGKQVEISVDLTTDANDVAAAEIRIPMPVDVTPVEGSCTKVDSRLPSHSVTGDLNGNEYVIVIFNTNLSPIPAGSGKAVSFKVNLGENPGVFDLTPRVKLSDASGKALQTSASGETLSILGAKLELSETDIDFGRVPIRGAYTKSVTATNTGTSKLNFSDFSTDVPGLTVTSESQSLEPNEKATLTLDYQPTVRAASISGRFTAISNSVGRAPFVRVTSVPFSVNELHVGSAEGISDSEQSITVSMNNMEPIVGAEVSFQLPEGLEYVDGSLEPASRASGFTASANYGADRNLRLVLFNLNNKAAAGDDGELMTFKLKLTGCSGSYALTPQNVILSNSASENMLSATSAGLVTIQSPSMQASSTMDIGNVPLSGDNTFDYPVYNGSSVPLTLEKVLFLDEVAECKAEFPIIIEANSNGNIPVTIRNPKFGEFASTMNVYSNDPDNRMKAVSITGNFYSANELTVEQTIDNGKCVLTAGVTNETEIVALQLDIIMPAGCSELSESDLTLLSRAQSHSATLAKIADNKYRIIIFSLTNAPFTGNSGGIFSLSFEGSEIEGKQIRIDNVKLSGKDGINYTTPNSDIIVDNVPVEARSIELSAISAELKVGEAVTLTAKVLPDDTTDKTVTWTSSDEKVAKVDANGKVTAIALGEATITAKCGAVSASCKVTVVPTPAESVTLDKTSAELKVGATVTLTATVLPDDTTDKTITWTSSDEKVAKVDANGKVTAIALGEATITAKCGAVSATCKVSVVPTPAESVTLDKTSAELKVGETVTLGATVLPDDTTDKTVTWSSSDEKVAKVDAKGKVTAIALGEATITATCGTATATCKVTVVPTPAESVTLDKTSAELKVGETVTLTATVLPDDTTDKTVTWTSSDEKVAKVDAKGKVTAIALGEATVTAKCGSATATCKVTVVPTPAESITLSNTELKLNEGATATLTVTIAPENATDKSVTWSTSDAKVATVSDKGVVTAVKAGTATITATSANGKTATCKVTVAANIIAVETITISKSELSMTEGDTATLTATITPANATDKTVTWTSSDTAVATVSAEGVVTAVGAGSATITAASSNGKTATCSVKVAAKVIAVTSVVLDKKELSLTEGETATLTATIAPENATDKTVTWSTSDESVATVSDKGVVTAIKAGKATITATSANGKTAICALTVAAKIIEVTGITLSNTELKLNEGATATLTATIAPENATDKSVTWSTSDAKVATVSDKGVVTAVKAGTATITATSANGKTATCKVTVAANIIAVETITISKTELSMTEGDTATLTATVTPDNATDKTVTWTSSDAAVATVSAEGVVTAVGAGTATITAASSNGKTATCEVTVLPKVVLVESLTIDPTSWTGEEGSEFKINATVLPENATDKSVAFESTDESVATVGAEGNVKVLKEGSCKIIVSTLDGSDLTAECVITSTVGVAEIFGESNELVDVYDMNGNQLKHGCKSEDLKQLAPGLYILRSGNKVVKTLIR